MSRREIDVSVLPTYAFGSRGPVWWGSLCVMIVEGAMFLFVLLSYFYLQGTVYEWPPGASVLPDISIATINTIVLLVSCVPNYFLKGAAERLDLKKVRLLIPIMLLFAIVFLTLRAFEFTQLKIGWTDNAYGSVLWTLLGLHTTHLLTDAFDTGVLAAMLFRNPVEARRLVDTSENCVYWYFVIAAWLPIYFVVYLFPRM